MGVVGIFKDPPNHDIILDWINETQWIQKNGGAVVNLNLVIRTGSEAQQFTVFEIVVPYRIEQLRDASDDWLNEANVTYYSNTSGDYFRVKDADKRLIEDAKGEIFANQVQLATETKSIPGGRFLRDRYYTRIYVQLLHPIGPNQRHMVQIEFYAFGTAFRRAAAQRLAGSNWYFVNRYYSVYEVWDTDKRTSSLEADEARLLPVELFENWIALPGFARSAQFSPEPMLQSVVTVSHPGYVESLLGIQAQVVARFRLPAEPGPQKWYSKHVFGEYEAQPLPIWVEQVGFLLGVIGFIIGVISLIPQPTSLTPQLTQMPTSTYTSTTTPTLTTLPTETLSPTLTPLPTRVPTPARIQTPTATSTPPSHTTLKSPVELTPVAIGLPPEEHDTIEDLDEPTVMYAECESRD